MCGLTFVCQEHESIADIVARSRHALRLIKHRGPDEEGLIHGGNWVAGHRRLSIVDLGRSHQPMQDASNRYTLVFNGEVYNFKDLRKQLEEHWQFVTQGDTEVVLAGLSTLGTAFLEKMHGMWAIAYWDDKERKLILSRDRVGKKPLYYQSNKHFFACASEIRALSALSPDVFEEDLNSTADYLKYGYYIPGTTAYKNIYEVLPGHVLCWQPGGSVVQTPYWQLKVRKFSGSEQDAAEITRSLFVNSVKKRLVADVEVGAFLSGGIDSSLVTSIMSKEFGVTPKTFTIGFSDKSYDERSYAKKLSSSLNTEHHEAVLTDWNPEDLLSLIMNNVGQPFADSSILPTALVSKLASEKVKVVLSGDGSDEIFSGYQRYQARLIFKWYFKLPSHLRALTFSFLKLFPQSTAHHSRSILKKAQLFVEAAKRYSENPLDVAPTLYTAESYSKIAPELTSKGHHNRLQSDVSNEDDVLQMMFNDVIFYLPQDILTKVDRASMAHSLEVRSPFLDTELIEHSFSIPRHWHRRGFSGKKMLKSSFDDYLPSYIWKRRKQGFAVPLANWFKGKLGDDLTQLLAEQTDLCFQADQVKSMLSQHIKQTHDHSMRLWCLYVYLMWKHSKPWQVPNS